MPGSENVYNVVQLGRQAGTFYVPGSAVPATFLYPVSEAVNFELDRGSTYPQQDRGRNVRNHSGTGYHGVRGANGALPSEVRFEDIMDILEMCYAGDVAPASLGGGLFGWTYPFEAGAPTVIPYTIQTGNIDLAEAQHQIESALVDELTFGFDDLTVPGASPWTLNADILGFTREIEPVTDSLEARTGLQTVQGHLSRIELGDVTDAFDALTELDLSLVSYQHTAQRNLARRAYGSTDDVPKAFGYTAKSNGMADVKIRVSTEAKTILHDSWNTSETELGELRMRIEAAGSGGRILRIDGRVGVTAMPYDERDGERVYNVHVEYVDDDDLGASHQVYVVNGIATLGYGS